MARPPEERARLRAAYIHDRLPLEAAAEKAGIPVGTARRWKSAADAEGDDWDKARAAYSLTAAGTATVAQLVLADYLGLHLSTMEALKGAQIEPLDKAEAMSRLADAFTKTMAAVAKAAPELGRLAVISETLRELGDYARDQFPEHLEAIVAILEGFAAAAARKYG